MLLSTGFPSGTKRLSDSSQRSHAENGGGDALKSHSCENCSFATKNCMNKNNSASYVGYSVKTLSSRPHLSSMCCLYVRGQISLNEC